jgi:cation diffusion facilitator CzcD-associated flavoprotein CzcO
MYKIAIVGLGPAGIFTLALLPPELLPHTVIFESGAVGGALATSYGSVVANITRAVIESALRSVPRWSELSFPHLEKYVADVCPLLNDAIRQLRDLITPDLALTTFHTQQVQDFEYFPHRRIWQLKTSSKLFETQKVILCTGATPRIMDLPKPHIPLPIALDPVQIQKFVSPRDRIVVFGTAHSGTLILRNLRDAGVSSLTGIYKSAAPFQYARDGYSEGIKAESAAIADDLLANKWASLVNLDDFSATYRVVEKASFVVYAIGFERPTTTYLMDGMRRAFFEGGGTADIDKNVWGFGIGYPSSYTSSDGKSYPDVGFGGFVSAIKAALPLMLTFAP